MDPVHVFWALSLGTGRFGRRIGVGWARSLSCYIQTDWDSKSYRQC